MFLFDKEQPIEILKVSVSNGNVQIMLMSNFGHKRYQKVTKVLFYANNSCWLPLYFGCKVGSPLSISLTNFNEFGVTIN